MNTIKRAYKTLLYSSLVLFGLGFMIGAVKTSDVIMSLLMGVIFAILPLSAPVIIIFFKTLTGGIATEEISILIGATVLYILVHFIFYKFLKRKEVDASKIRESGILGNYEKFGFFLLGITLTIILLLIYVGSLKALM